MGKPKARAGSFAQTYALSAVAACVAESATYPFDIVRSRLQASAATGAARREGGMVRTGLAIVRDEGAARPVFAYII